MFVELARAASEAAEEAHASVTATWLDWALWVALLPGGFILLSIFAINRKNEIPPLKKVGLTALASFLLGAGACFAIWLQHGNTAGQEYLAGWLVELSLSFDNVFTWGLVVSSFVIWRGYHQRLVMWGVVIAIVLRVAFILGGVGLINLFWWFSLILGGLLVWVGFKVKSGDDEGESMNIQNSFMYRAVTKRLPMAEDNYATAYVTRQEGGIKFTNFGMAVAVFGAIDVMFAIDSIPAILAVARDPFIVISSNMMALIGLQSLYFLYDAVKNSFSRLNEALAVIMWFVGLKIIIGSELLPHIGKLFGKEFEPFELPIWISLSVILGLLAFGIILSRVRPEKRQKTATMEEELTV